MTETIAEKIISDLSEYHSQQAAGQGLTETYIIDLDKEKEIIAKHTDAQDAKIAELERYCAGVM